MPPRRLASAIGICVLSTACSGVAPVDPSALPRVTGEVTSAVANPRSTVQRVEESGSGGGAQCLLVETTVCIDVSLTSGGTVLSVINAMLPHDPNRPVSDFSIRVGLRAPAAGIKIVPPGILVPRFDTALLQAFVQNGTANVNVELTGQFDNGRTFVADGSAPVVQSQTPCTRDGSSTYRLVVTTALTLQLQHLGRTDIVISRVLRCTP